MELQEYLSVARRRWISILVGTFVVMALAAAITWQTTPQYASSTRLFITTAPDNTSDAYTGSLFSLQRIKSYANLVSGKEISSRVIQRLNLDESPRELSKQITATAAPDTVILTITATDPSPDRARILASAVSREFVTYVSELETPPGSKQATIKATVVDGATTPTAPVSPNVRRNLGVGAILGLLVGIGVAVLRETLDSSIKAPKDLETLTEAPVIGTVPYDSQATKHPLISDLDGHAPRPEAFRVLRTNFQFIDPGQQHKVYTVSSAHPNEGKSTTAANLAISLAQGNESVVVVEGDLRRPRISEYFRLEASVGVTTVLVGQATLDHVTQNVSGHRVDVVASGARPPNPAELIKSDGMREIIEALRDRYDVVLIDAPPLLPVTDAALLATLGDGTILVVRHGKTTRDEIATAVGRLEAVDARLAGVILNMAPHQRGLLGSRYGYGYGYGYGPGPAQDPETPPAKGRKARKAKKKAKRADKKTADKKTAAPAEPEEDWFHELTTVDEPVPAEDSEPDEEPIPLGEPALKSATSLEEPGRLDRPDQSSRKYWKGRRGAHARDSHDSRTPRADHEQHEEPGSPRWSTWPDDQ